MQDILNELVKTVVITSIGLMGPDRDSTLTTLGLEFADGIVRTKSDQ